MIKYTLATFWHERYRFLPGILAVALSDLLILVQCGLLLGLFSLTSTPIDHAPADLWVAHHQVLSVDLGKPIPRRWQSRLESDPAIAQVEPYLMGLVELTNPAGKWAACTAVGTRLGGSTIGGVRELTPEVRSRLTERGAVAIDESEMGTLGITGEGDTAEVYGHRVRVVAVLRGADLKSLATPYLFCSLETATMLIGAITRDQTVFLVARCRPGQAPEEVAKRLRERYPDMGVYSSAEFAHRTQMYWLTTTKSGIAAGWAAALGLLVGVVITTQTLFAATAASWREYAVLEALGIPRWRMVVSVLIQAGWVGVAGILIALPMAGLLSVAVTSLGGQILLPTWLTVTGSTITLSTALLAGVFSLRSLRLADPGQLLR